jgi:hypothetical protein
LSNPSGKGERSLSKNRKSRKKKKKKKKKKKEHGNKAFLLRWDCCSVVALEVKRLCVRFVVEFGPLLAFGTEINRICSFALVCVA